jgi:hypothetical protein
MGGGEVPYKKRATDGLLATTFYGEAGLGWYYLSFTVLWKNIHPLIPLYTHSGAKTAGHVFYRALPGGFPRHMHTSDAE